jgi:hypothetical protein
MKTFDDREELEAWLEALDYQGFWREIAPFGLALPDRAECDARIGEGVDRATVLSVLQMLARMQIVEGQNLRLRVMVHGLPH